jgi:hypothetical protein
MCHLKGVGVEQNISGNVRRLSATVTVRHRLPLFSIVFSAFSFCSQESGRA